MSIHKITRQLITLAILMVMGSSCKQANDEVLLLADTMPSGCEATRKVIHRVSSVFGTVGYHTDPSQLTISYALPGTIDSQWTGVVCNLPKEFQIVGKRVTFSGEFRDAEGKFKPVLGGQEMYYLYLTALQPL